MDRMGQVYGLAYLQGKGVKITPPARSERDEAGGE
jgi:hypothetical protein